MELGESVSSMYGIGARGLSLVLVYVNKRFLLRDRATVFSCLRLNWSSFLRNILLAERNGERPSVSLLLYKC